MEGSDRASVAQARAGDPEAFCALVERHSRSVFRLGYRMTGNAHDAEEVVQETFLRAYRRLDRFEARSQFGTWLYRIATHCALDLLRSRQRHQERREPDDPEGSEAVQALPSGDPGPERLLLSAEVQKRVTEVLDGLGRLERAAFVLRHFEGFSIEEICQTLDLRESAAKNNIFRAVKKLRRALEPAMRSRR